MRADWKRRLLILLYGLCVLFFLGKMAKLCDPDHGFSGLIQFGSYFEARSLRSLRSTTPKVLPDSHGYDGQFHAQLALSPLLEDPQLKQALDNPAYRSRRILFSWTAWLLGLGQPDWIVQAYALQNVLFWLVTAVLLATWLPPTSWFNFVRWASMLFSSGLMASATRALLDGPSLALLLLGVFLYERNRASWAATVLGVSLLGKETNALAWLGMHDPRPGRYSLPSFGVQAVLLMFPLVVWLLYVRAHFPMQHSFGSGAFGLPFASLLGKCDELAPQLHLPYARRTALAFIAFAVQIVYFFTQWHWSNHWWRIGFTYALLGVFLGTAVMEGHPGAFTRSMLALHVAFNLSLKNNGKGWALLILGNLGLFDGLAQLGVSSRVLLCG